MSKRLNSIGVSRLYTLTRTTKIEQLENTPSWRQAKSTLKDLKQAGLLTLIEATKNRIVIQWEPRVFPNKEIKNEAQRTLDVIKHDLTLAFQNQQDREKFMHWLNKSGLLHQS